MEKRVFWAIDKFLPEEDEGEAESVSSEATVTDGYTSDGDQYQETMALKKKKSPRQPRRHQRRRPQLRLGPSESEKQ